MLKRTLLHYWDTLFQFSLELNFVKTRACRHRRSVPIESNFIKEMVLGSQFLAISSLKREGGSQVCTPRCCPGPEQMCPGFSPDSLLLCQPHPQQLQCGGTRCFGGKNRISRKMGQESGLQDAAQIPSASEGVSVPLSAHRDSEFWLCSTSLPKTSVSLWILPPPFRIRAV